MNREIVLQCQSAVVKIDPLGLTISGEVRTEEFRNIGMLLQKLQDMLMWAKADWLASGEVRQDFGLMAAADMLGIKYQTAKNLAHIARAWPRDKRLPDLSFTHHAELASLSEQERQYFVEIIRQRKLTIAELRTLLKSHSKTFMGQIISHREMPLPRSFDTWFEEYAEARGIDLQDRVKWYDDFKAAFIAGVLRGIQIAEATVSATLRPAMPVEVVKQLKDEMKALMEDNVNRYLLAVGRASSSS
ncbi:MAG: hypothetical protein QXP01_01220 [Candidatus Hadarchaeum sp.]